MRYINTRLLLLLLLLLSNDLFSCIKFPQDVLYHNLLESVDFSGSY